ncbi:AAA-like domain-containing protein [Dendronalium sp. ChiSLP03b]|uniref:AAA-like domain-containing protein n=1 Tax=Dendronalium sp. ChiSLP03b TaxID=3075381 RepID=UPI002AD4CBA8|nr:AAA-like domain-containing protein [Dendronalium sp. ChiSLP03b]MDZ8208821.1 AAA-like domain-containing protein [Dendronalium sp. ChiSLP03b]
MNLNSLFEIVDRLLIESHNRPLNSTENLILHGIWQYRTYNQIAIEAGYSPGYFTNVVAPELFGRLSEVIGQRVTKKNCRVLLESYATTKADPKTKPLKQDLTQFPATVNQDTLPCYPSGSVPLDSPFYLERSFLEEQIYQEIGKPGALIRIKAPREMGKTSLLLRILDYAKHQGYCTISLNLEQVEQTILSDLNQLLRWLCANIAHQLQRQPMLDEYWDEDLGSKISSTLYFQEYLLESINTPLILALDEVNHIFEHPQVAKDFLPLLRSWYEEAKRLPIWQKLRLLVVHSTDVYVPLELNQSPFNVGLPIQLNNFSQEEVQQLAQCYGLNWTDGERARQLMAMVGGHPALVHLALYHLSRKEITLSQLLETAPTASGIYAHHLQRHWATLQKQPELAQAFDTILNANEAISLDPILTHKLSSMGLIKLSGSQAIATCELYRRFFSPLLSLSEVSK